MARFVVILLHLVLPYDSQSERVIIIHKAAFMHGIQPEVAHR